MSLRLLAALSLLTVSTAFAQTETAPAAAPAPSASDFLSNVRLRSGFSVVGGPTVPVGRSNGGLGGLGGAQARLGAQLTDLFSVYYQATALVGMQVNIGAGTASSSIFVGVYNSVLAGVTLNDMFDFGIGPSSDVIVGLGGGGGSGGASAGFVVGTGLWGAHARAALHLGGRKAGSQRRNAFTISLDAHPTFASGSTLFIATLGLGGEWY